MLDTTSKKYLPIEKSVEALSNILNHSKQIIEFLGNGWTNSQNGQTILNNFQSFQKIVGSFFKMLDCFAYWNFSLVLCVFGLVLVFLCSSGFVQVLQVWKLIPKQTKIYLVNLIYYILCFCSRKLLLRQYYCLKLKTVIASFHVFMPCLFANFL